MGAAEKRYLELAEKWMNGTINEEEEKEFADWYNAGQEKEIVLPGDFALSREDLEKRIFQRILQQRTNDSGNSSKRSYSLFKRLAVAAAILVTVATSLFVFYEHNRKLPAVSTITAHDVSAPSLSKAVITLDNGRQIVLDSASNGTLAVSGTTTITKLSDDKVSYRNSEHNDAGLVYNTLSVPRGSKVVSLVLSDGTQVWLNAESTMQFPVAFAASERRVVITGEAYFEVAKETKRKFYVDNGSFTTEVLGTHFNINAYSDESVKKVTLLEGSVRVVKEDDQHSITLVPGQQAQVSATLQQYNDADIPTVMAWKNGMFTFNNTDVASIIRQLSRWYDVTVTFADDVQDKHFTGAIGRQESMSQVLHLLELTDVIHFKIEGKKVSIYK